MSGKGGERRGKVGKRREMTVKVEEGKRGKNGREYQNVREEKEVK